MRFVFSDGKTAQAAGLLLQKAGGTLPTTRLTQMLYLADRQSLIETGYPITGAQLVATDHGLALSEVLDLFAWGSQAESQWWEYISPPADYEVTLKKAPQSTELSEYETDLLAAVAEQYGAWDAPAIRHYTKGLAEWNDPRGATLPVDVRVILQDAGKSDDDIQSTAATAAEIYAFHKAFDRVG